MEDSLQVVNRKGETEEISFDEIKNRIKRLANFTNPDYIEYPLSHVNTTQITIETISKLFDGITTRQLDIESAKVCANLESVHPNYGLLGGRILSSDHHKHLKNSNLNTFTDRLRYLNDNLRDFYNSSFVEFVLNNEEQINSILEMERDFLISYFGFKTLEKSYLIRHNDEPIETPQDVFLRVAINIHYRSSHDLETIFEMIKNTYDLTSKGYFTHATPTLFNAGTRFEQMSSCYLLGTEDSLTGIFKTITDTAQISKWAGGIGIHISNIRATNSLINSTNGKSNGILPMLKVYNETARYINQGGKRKGSFAIYLEPWHADIISFLDLKKNTGAETERARDLFTALWIPDEFMRRVEANDDWYIMCPNECPGLNEVYDKEDSKDFTNLYLSYIKQGKYREVLKAQDIFHKIMESQIETGVPYIAFKDNINRKSNQSNIGIVKSSNLCSEITEVSSSEEYAVCNLGSIAVNKFIKLDELKKLDTFNIWKRFQNNTSDKEELKEIIKSIYDFDHLKEVSYTLTYNLNNIIDHNYYPVPETRKSNLKNRPIGVGVQGLGDIYYMLNIPYNYYAARYIDALIMETIYYGSVSASNYVATINSPYQTYEGSPFSQGILQYDLWNHEQYPKIHDWESLKEKIKISGMANSLLTALMPTATTSQILGNNECFEPYSSNIYKRTTLAGEFQVVNRHLVNILLERGLWNEKLRSSIVSLDGSIQNINISSDNPNYEDFEYLKQVYKTVWEVKQKDIIDHAIARSPYVDQSQSMNLFFAKPDFKSLFSAIMYGWKNGLKTGCYYLRSKPATEAAKFSIDVSESKTESEQECLMCSA